MKLTILSVLLTILMGMANAGAQTLSGSSKKRVGPDTDYLLRLMDEASSKSEKTRGKMKSLAPSMMLNSASAAGSTTFSVPMYDYPPDPDCIPNQNIAYNMDLFSANTWYTSFYNWDISTTLLDPTRPYEGAMSERYGYYPSYAVDSDMWYRIPRTYTTNGDPRWYSLKFWYQYHASRPGDQFIVGIVEGSFWQWYAIMPTAFPWERVSFLIPPTSTGDGTYLMFRVHRAAGTIATGPTANIAALQLCPLDTYPKKSDFVVKPSTNNTVVVAWNAISYPPPRYVLKRANGVGTNNSFLPITNSVQLTGVTAYVVFPLTNQAGFFRISSTN